MRVFGEPQVASRAGVVLYIRMLPDNMTDVKYRGTVYLVSAVGEKVRGRGPRL